MTLVRPVSSSVALYADTSFSDVLVVISRIHFTHSRHVHVWREQEAVNFDARDFRNSIPESFPWEHTDEGPEYAFSWRQHSTRPADISLK
jgi:hypothetical protein